SVASPSPALPLIAASGPYPRVLPGIGSIVGITEFSGQSTQLMAAQGDSLFVVDIGPGSAPTVRALRLGGAKTLRRRIDVALGADLDDVSTGRFGFYLGTDVPRRFSAARNELLRLDPKTLKIVARARFIGAVATSERGSQMWATVGGRVLRLDPRSLQTLKARRVPDFRATPLQTTVVSKPAIGLGSIWVLVSNGHESQLVRLDPTTLAGQSQIRVPETRGRDSFLGVIANPTHVYLSGSRLASVDRSGAIRLLPTPTLGTAIVDGNAALATDETLPELFRIDADGHIEARAKISSGPMTLSARTLWIQGGSDGQTPIREVRLGADPTRSHGAAGARSVRTRFRYSRL
ncbi:MAG TPA: hypothetical protein VMH41_08920, partial [Mycobacteriales bacterium]|nr:hypothetical protein [Mycobacteriales bacterium]